MCIYYGVRNSGLLYLPKADVKTFFLINLATSAPMTKIESWSVTMVLEYAVVPSTSLLPPGWWVYAFSRDRHLYRAK